MKRKQIGALMMVLALTLMLTGCTAGLDEVSDEILTRLDEEEGLLVELSFEEAPCSGTALVLYAAELREAPQATAAVISGANAGELLTVVSSAQSAEGKNWYGVVYGGGEVYIAARSVQILSEEELEEYLNPEEEIDDPAHTQGDGSPCA